MAQNNYSSKFDDHFPIPARFNPGNWDIYMENRVQLMGLMPVMYENLLPKIAHFWKGYKPLQEKYPNVKLVITSAREGVHVRNSRHYLGLAVDLRTKNFDRDFIYVLCADMQEHLGPRWRVIMSKNCLHIQYQGYVVESGR